jgi:hypothetical protein
MLKKFTYAISAILICSVIADSMYRGVYSSTSGAPAGTCGAPADGGATCKNCHSGPAAIPLSGMIASNVPPSGYIPGTTYTVTATINRPGHVKFGFQVSPQNSAGTLLGTLQNITSETQIFGGKYITHTAGSTNGSGSRTWSFNWIAPAAGTGDVTFYGALNAANSNNLASGDTIFTSTLLVNEATVSAAEIFNGIYIDVYPNPAKEKIFISLDMNQQEITGLKIMDVHGNLQKQFSEEAQKNRTSPLSVEINDFASGVYFILIETDRTRFAEKIVVIK